MLEIPFQIVHSKLTLDAAFTEEIPTNFLNEIIMENIHEVIEDQINTARYTFIDSARLLRAEALMQPASGGRRSRILSGIDKIKPRKTSLTQAGRNGIQRTATRFHPSR